MGLIWLLLWAVVAYFMVTTFVKLDGVSGAVARIKEGDFLPLVLLTASIILLAMAIRSLSLYFSPQKDRNNNGRR
jgi:uncharacterized membrane protein